MKPIRITAVSYSNTLPLIHGIQHSGLLHNFTLDLAVPSECAMRLLRKEADISLVPVGAFPLFGPVELVSNYCIGAVGDVRSVLLLANDPVAELKSVYLDTDSRTSVNLVKILAQQHWKINPQWISLVDKPSGPLKKREGMVLIGDKTFGISSQFLFSYDLAGEWKQLTGLPFVFAAWISGNPLPESFIREFEAAQDWGIRHIPDSTRLSRNPLISRDELIRYLMNDIDFILDPPKREGMELFLKYLKELSDSIS